MSSERASNPASAARMTPSTRRNAVLAVAAVFALGIVVPVIFGPVETSRAARGAGSTGPASTHTHAARVQTVRDDAQARLRVVTEDLQTRADGNSLAPTT